MNIPYQLPNQADEIVSAGPNYRTAKSRKGSRIGQHQKAIARRRKANKIAGKTRRANRRK